MVAQVNLTSSTAWGVIFAHSVVFVLANGILLPLQAATTLGSKDSCVIRGVRLYHFITQVDQPTTTLHEISSYTLQHNSFQVLAHYNLNLANVIYINGVKHE